MTDLQVVYDAFLAKMLEDEWVNWDLEDIEEDWKSLLKGALPWFKFPRVSLEFDVNEEHFEDDLSNMTFENLLTIKGNDEICLPEEIITYINVLNALAPAYQDGTFDIWAYAESHPEEVAYAFELLKSAKLLVEIIPVGIEFAGTLPEVQDLLNEQEIDYEDDTSLCT